LHYYSTDRLDLIAATLKHLLAELESSKQLASSLNTVIGTDWPPGEYDRGAQEFFRDQLLENGEKAIGRYGWYAIRRASVGQQAVVVAACGYFGPPTRTGEVKIGCSVPRSFRGQGYATEIAQALARIAFSDSRVHRVIARTTLKNLHPSRFLREQVLFEVKLSIMRRISALNDFGNRRCVASDRAFFSFQTLN